MDALSNLFNKCLPVRETSSAVVRRFSGVLTQQNLRRNSQVHPAGVPPVIVINAAEIEGDDSANHHQQTISGDSPVQYNRSGHQLVVEDEAEVFNADSGDLDDDKFFRNQHRDDVSENSLQPHKKRRLSTISEKLLGDLHPSDNYLTTVFIETGKRRQLRVIHLKAKEMRADDESPSEGSEVDEEEEYWFTKWSTKKRLKKKVAKPAVPVSLPDAPKEVEEIVKNAVEDSNPMPVVAEEMPSMQSDAGIEPDASQVDGKLGEGAYGITNLGFQVEDESGEMNEDMDSVPPSVEVLNVDQTSCEEDEPVKPLLFFIHSLGGSSEVWKTQMDFFHALGYEIVAIDLLGHGLSSTPPQMKLYHFESLVQDVITVFDHFIQDETRQVVLVAHGYGSCIASVLTRVRPKNVYILVSIAGGGPTPMVSSYWCNLRWFPCTTLWGHKKKGRYTNPDLKNVIPTYIMDNYTHGQIWLDGDPAFHRRITIPTLLVYGMRDKIVHLVEVCEMERSMPRAYLELIPTAGHMVMWDEPKKLNRMIRRFIEAQWL